MFSLPRTMCGPFCSVPPVGRITVVLPALMASRTSTQVSSSTYTLVCANAGEAAASSVTTADEMRERRITRSLIVACIVVGQDTRVDAPSSPRTRHQLTQEFRGVELPSLRRIAGAQFGNRQRSASALVFRLQPGALVDEELHDGIRPANHGAVQRGKADGIAGVHVGAQLHTELH